MKNNYIKIKEQVSIRASINGTEYKIIPLEKDRFAVVDFVYGKEVNANTVNKEQVQDLLAGFKVFGKIELPDNIDKFLNNSHSDNQVSEYKTKQ